MTRTQWLDFSSLEIANLVGKNILIVDEVDDTRTTLEYAVRELEKDVKDAAKRLGREGESAEWSVFVLHVSRILDTSKAGPERDVNITLEQEQAQKGPITRSHDERPSLHGCAHCRRRVDLLSLGVYVWPIHLHFSDSLSSKDQIGAGC